MFVYNKVAEKYNGSLEKWYSTVEYMSAFKSRMKKKKVLNFNKMFP